MIKAERSDFFPVGSLEGKKNYKQIYRIRPDGAIIERVVLDVPDTSHREQLICLHYLRHIVRCFLAEDIEVNILGRDVPWDFKLELSSGQKFKLEITAVADGAQHFEKDKREERLTKWKAEDNIPFHELKKLNKIFPDPEIATIINGYNSSGVTENTFVKNPFKSEEPHILLSSLPKTERILEDRIRAAIDSKLQKEHPDKDKTVLIIDNRTSSFDVSDYFSASMALKSFVNSIPFPEIWFYTGYYSDDDGNNAEFSFAPIKITSEQGLLLEKLKANKAIDKKGRIIL